MGDKTLVEVDSIFGRIEAFADDLVTTQILQFGAHTRPELAFLLSAIDLGDALFDLGGHIGSYALPMARKTGAGGRLLVVEGLPETFAVLERNLRRSRLAASVTVINALVASVGSRYVPKQRADNTGATYFAPGTDEGGDAVRVVTIDELCREFFFPRVLKIDLEGFEAIALAGAPELLSRHPIIYVEVVKRCLDRNGSTASEIDRLLRGGGYRYFRNVGERNAAHDSFVVSELGDLAAGGDFFDVLAIHRDDDRLTRMLERTRR